MFQRSDRVLAGNLYGLHPGMAQLPPFIPVDGTSVPSSEGQAMNTAAPAQDRPPVPTGWDTRVVIHNINWSSLGDNKEYSGWERDLERLDEETTVTAEQQPQLQQALPRENHGPLRRDLDLAAQIPSPHLSVPTPRLEYDFRMRVTLNAQSAAMAVSDGFKKWTTFTGGEWSGKIGHGIVVSGGQDSQDLVHGKTLATQIEATHRLKTADDVPAYIECKTRGFRSGPPDLMRKIGTHPESVNLRLLPHRVTISMRTTDERYAEKANFGLWIGSCLWTGSEVIYDAYRVS
ncbi:hypothetical protein F5Y16DRAFT_383265 [Xylariaceae sp. FL0255]|nr:hypothetical protein F5Y16DRAFT_383265 [Xylariaceae sp. FL0255]